MKIVVLLGIANQLDALFAYDKAAHAGQLGQWQEAMQNMTSVVSKNPHNAQVLYDAGVAAYRNKDFVQAQAYFHQASQVSTVEDVSFQERAYFNEGNSFAQIHRYQEGIDCYEKVLQLNSDNQQARENIALLKQLLAQQDKEHNKKQDQQQSPENKDQQNSSPQRQDQNQDQTDQDNQDNRQQSDQNNEQNENDQKDENDSSATSQSSDEHTKDSEKESSPEQQQESSEKQSPQQGQKQQQNHPQQQGASPQAAQSSAPPPEATERQGEKIDKQEHIPSPVSAWLDTVLSEQQKQDEKVNKGLIKMQAEQQSKGSSNAAAHNW